VAREEAAVAVGSRACSLTTVHCGATRESIRFANRSNEAAYHDPRPFILPLFTGVRGREILRTSVVQEATKTSPS
jgi:hypothetical protein